MKVLDKTKEQMKLTNPFKDNGCRCPNKHAILPEERELAWRGIAAARRNEDLTAVLLNVAMLLPCKTRKMTIDEEEIARHLTLCGVTETVGRLGIGGAS